MIENAYHTHPSWRWGCVVLNGFAPWFSCSSPVSVWCFERLFLARTGRGRPIKHVGQGYTSLKIGLPYNYHLFSRRRIEKILRNSGKNGFVCWKYEAKSIVVIILPYLDELLLLFSYYKITYFRIPLRFILLLNISWKPLLFIITTSVG